MSTDASVQAYFDELPRALLNFQCIEEALKQYLMRSHVMIATAVHDFLPYDTGQAQDIAKLPLGKLVCHFRHLNNNHELIERLSSLPQQRNSLAHRGFIEAHRSHESGEPISTTLKKLHEVIEESQQCMHEVLKEIAALENRFVKFRASATNGGKT